MVSHLSISTKCFRVVVSRLPRRGLPRCGLLICHEWRYPELYRQYKKLKVDVIMQAWYDGGLNAADMEREGSVYSQVIPATVQGHAACNHFWIR